ncbi:hypothetical protein D3C86_2087880 [compost metagenome]
MSMVANTRRARMASRKVVDDSALPSGISTAVRLGADMPQLAQWLSWLVAKATW